MHDVIYGSQSDVAVGFMVHGQNVGFVVALESGPVLAPFLRQVR